MCKSLLKPKGPLREGSKEPLLWGICATQGKTKKSETNIRRKRALKLKGPLGEGSKESLLFLILPHYNP